MKVIDQADAAEFIAEKLEQASCDLERFYYSHDGRAIFKWHHYLSAYDRHLAPYRRLGPHLPGTVAKDGKLRILEIGVQNGGSLQLWRRYFGDSAIIFGIDIDPRCKDFEENDVNVRIGSQDDPEFLDKLIEEMGGLDIVLDDGSHISKHQLASFKHLFPKLSMGGLYICEDLHTSYWDGWEGGLRRPGTFIETIKNVIDHMHEWYVDVDSDLNELQLKTQVTGLHIYDSMAVIKKGDKTQPCAVTVGTPSF